MQQHERPGQGKYLSLTSYRRNGAPVATPVWFVTENGRLLVSTDAGCYKVKRIPRNPSVSIAACTATGRLRGEPVEARVELLPETEGPHVEELMARKYRFDRILVLPLYRAVQRLRHKQPAQGKPAYLAITPLR
ncbi:MAG: PPOX class F420-dependent oxidoreductase [Gaiellaceae bacterium]